MAESPFEFRLRAAGLRPRPADIAGLEVMVEDLDRAAAALRGPHDYALEPLSAFRLRPVGRDSGRPDVFADSTDRR